MGAPRCPKTLATLRAALAPWDLYTHYLRDDPFRRGAFAVMSASYGKIVRWGVAYRVPREMLVCILRFCPADSFRGRRCGCGCGKVCAERRRCAGCRCVWFFNKKHMERAWYQGGHKAECRAAVRAREERAGRPPPPPKSKQMKKAWSKKARGGGGKKAKKKVRVVR